MVMAMEGSLMRMGLFINERKTIIILALDIFDMTIDHDNNNDGDDDITSLNFDDDGIREGFQRRKINK